jgi:hypothetical protein
MTPQRWKGAGVALLVATALLIVASLFSALTGAVAPAGQPVWETYQQYVATPGIHSVAANGELRAVVFGVFAGVTFFSALACFAWSALGEAKQQRADILEALTALRTQSGPPPAA